MYLWRIKDAVPQLPADKNMEISFCYGFPGDQKYMLKTRLSSSGHPSYCANNLLFGPLGTETEVPPQHHHQTPFQLTDSLSSVTLICNTNNYVLCNSSLQRWYNNKNNNHHNRNTAHLLHTDTMLGTLFNCVFWYEIFKCKWIINLN